MTGKYSVKSWKPTLLSSKTLGKVVKKGYIPVYDPLGNSGLNPAQAVSADLDRVGG